MNRLAALDAAKRAVADRPNQYGAPEQNFERIAALWNTHFDNTAFDLAHGELTPTDVAIMLALVKIARLEADPSHADSWIDLAGYAGCGAEVSGAETFDGQLRAAGVTGITQERPAQNSDLVDDVLQRVSCPYGNADCLTCFPSESKFGFTVGETVNKTNIRVGDEPGIVAGFSMSHVTVDWPRRKGAIYDPRDLRHGP